MVLVTGPKLILLTDKFKIEWKQIEGHAGIPANERCDEIATSFADKVDVVLYDGPLAGYKVNIPTNQMTH